MSKFHYEDELYQLKSMLHFLSYAVEQSFDGMERQGEPRESEVIGYGAALCFQDVLARVAVLEKHVLADML